MQIRNRVKTTEPGTPFEKSLETELVSAWRELAQAINGGLKFSDNFNAESVQVSDTGLADTEFSVPHSLKRIPTGYVVTQRNKAGVVYDSGTANTTTTLYLKCSVANCSITVLVF